MKLHLFLGGALMLYLQGALSAQQTVTFYANISDPASQSGWVGHVWVGPNDDPKFGFYPDGLKSENGRKAHIDYTFKATDQQVQPGRLIVEAYRKKTYVIGINDCRGFATEIARAIGVQLPSKGLKSPSRWLADLVDLNFGKKN